MKSFFASLLALCCACSLHAQLTIVSTSQQNIPKETLDSAYLKCSYSLRFVKDATQPEKTDTEEMLLLIGKKVSYFFSYSQFQADSTMATMSPEQIMSALQDINKFKRGYFKYNLFKNYPDKKITTTDKIAMSTYKIEEPFETPDWKIAPDTMRILGYACQKATTSFRGRDYVAWFTSEIPVSNGPWKFAGLPGLILNIADAQNHYVFECSGIETPKEKITIDIKKENYVNVSKKEYNKVYARYLKDPIGFAQSSNPNVKITMTNNDGTKAKSQVMTIPHNPIELAP